MSFSGWLLATCVFIFIIIVALGIGWWIRNNSNGVPEPPNKYNSPQVWGKSFPSDNSAKNTCQLYEFPTSFLPADNDFIQGNPTFNASVLNSLLGTGTYPACLDPDQIMAIQLQHTCIAPEGVVDGAITRCNLINGGYTGVNGNEVYYSNNTCYKVPACAGQISLVSLAFLQPSATSPAGCMSSVDPVTTGEAINMKKCDPRLQDQIFRVTRINPGENPNSLKPGRGQNGLFSQILHRESGLCVQPTNDVQTVVFDGSYFGCPTTQLTVTGFVLSLTECQGAPFPGFVWMLLPPITYCSDTGPSGPAGCCDNLTTKCTGGQTVCTGGCTAGNTSVTPPQMIYTGDINVDDIPFSGGYSGLSGGSAVIQYLIDNNARAAYYGIGNDPDNAYAILPSMNTTTSSPYTTLPSIGTDSSQCIQQGFIAQYMTIPQYNTTIAEAVCLAAGTLGTVNCTALTNDPFGN